MPSIARASSPAPHGATSSPGSGSGSGASSQWHSVSPATRPLNLEVLEVTSLSLTVALTLAHAPGSSGGAGAGINAAGHSLRHQLSQASALGSAAGSSSTKHRRKHRTRHSTESDDELTAVEDDASAPPYISSAFSGTYPMRIPLSPAARPSFKELLSKGVVVSVNGRPWNRIVAHVTDDEEDGAAAGGTAAPPPAQGGLGVTGSEVEGGARERRRQQDRAVVVVYGLSPGNEYQVDLKVVGNVDHGAAEVAQASITTTTVAAASNSSGTASGTRSRANSIRKGGRSRSSSLLQPAAQSPAAASCSSNKPDAEAAPTNAPDGRLAIPSVERSAPSPDLPEDSQVAELRRLIADAALEKDDLVAQLKRSRRESQRTEASLRADVEALKRAMDKTTQPDLRSRQKSLALQEQVKQAWHAASEAEREHDSILNGMGELHGSEADVRETWQKSRTARDHAVEERDDAIEDDRKAMGKLDGELGSLQTKLDKQRTKRAKISKENEELRHKLDEVASAQREVEKRNDSIRQQRLLAEDYGPAGGIAGSALGGMLGGGAGYGRPGPWEYDGQWGQARATAPPRQPVHHPSLPGLAASAAEGAGLSTTTSTSNSTDLHNMLRGRQPPGTSAAYTPGTRPFYPTATSAAAPSSSSSSGPAAMATQGIPLRSGNNNVSHVGNPIGFYPSQSAASTSTNRPFRVLSRDGINPSTTATAGPISPLMANVTAAPFMPANRLHASSTSPEPPQGSYLSPAYDHQTTSLVPPQLQHRIYLPQSRNKLSPSLISPGDETAEARIQEEGPAFPPLPSQTATLNANKTLLVGPSLASIVTRAIIPTAQASASAPNSATQRSPSGSLRGPPTGLDYGAPRSGGALSPSSPWATGANVGAGVPARQASGTPPIGGWPGRIGTSSGSGSGGTSRRGSLQAQE